MQAQNSGQQARPHPGRQLRSMGNSRQSELMQGWAVSKVATRAPAKTPSPQASGMPWAGSEISPAGTRPFRGRDGSGANDSLGPAVRELRLLGTLGHGGLSEVVL